MTGIILAAGLSERMGTNKLLLTLGGRTLLSLTIEHALRNLDALVVVTGNERERIERIASEYGVKTVFCPDYRDGQRQSTLKGIESVIDDDFAIIPGDLPLIMDEDYRQGMELLGKADAVRPVHDSIPGHPVMYRKENRERLLASPLSMKEYLMTVRLAVFQGSIGTVTDADTPEDFRRLSALYGNLAIDG